MAGSLKDEESEVLGKMEGDKADIYSVLITGASRGIGLEFVRQILENNTIRARIIIATCRTPEAAADLQELKKSNTKLNILKLDVDQFDTYDKIVNEVRTIVGDGGLSLLINNAGIGPNFVDTLQDLTPQKYISFFTTNSIAPVILTKAFHPLLKQSAKVHSTKTDGLGVTRAAVINIGTLAGSIMRTPELMTQYGLKLWGYNESKASLNMSTQALAIELEKDGILVECIHPGGVLTDMLKVPLAPPHELTAPASVSAMISVMLKLTRKNREGFYDYKGNVLPF